MPRIVIDIDGSPAAIDLVRPGQEGPVRVDVRFGFLRKFFDLSPAEAARLGQALVELAASAKPAPKARRGRA